LPGVVYLLLSPLVVGGCIHLVVALRVLWTRAKFVVAAALDRDQALPPELRETIDDRVGEAILPRAEATRASETVHYRPDKTEAHIGQGVIVRDVMEARSHSNANDRQKWWASSSTSGGLASTGVPPFASLARSYLAHPTGASHGRRSADRQGVEATQSRPCGRGRCRISAPRACSPPGRQ
jgi:hypothetical protein